MAGPASLGERMVLRTFWMVGKVGLGGLLTRFYMWTLATAGPMGMPMVFKGYQPSKADVFICTFAKSGTNWMMQIVTQISDYGDAEFDDIHDRVPWPEAPVPSQVAPIDTPPVSKTGLRGIKTHVPAEHVPIVDEARYIAVLRDPTEVFVSSYYFVGGIINGIWGVPPGLDDWFARWTEERFPLGSWAEHTAGWWALRDRPNVLVLTFAELKRDLEGSVRRVADHMGVELSDAQLAKVVDRSTFDWMKTHQHLFETPVPTVGAERAVMIRSGKTGNAHELLSEQQLEQIRTVSQAELSALGSALTLDQLQ